MRTFCLLLTGAVLAACAAVPPSPELAARSQARLDTHLAGRVAGPPVSCLQRHQARDMITISDNTILFKDGGTVYRNDPPGGCPGLGSGNYALITQNPQSNLCRGDLARVVDVQSGMMIGNCALGEFVPFRRAAI